MQPLPIPTEKFDTVTMDFTAGLPKLNGKNALMVCCNKLGKLTHLVPTWVGENHLAAPEVAKLFFANWVQYYGVPKGLVQIVICILLCHSGVPCGPCSECEHYLVVLTIHKLRAKRNVKTIPSRKLYVL